jgi:hypothetical protein
VLEFVGKLLVVLFIRLSTNDDDELMGASDMMVPNGVFAVAACLFV